MSRRCAGGCGLPDYVEFRHLWKNGYCMECFQRNDYLKDRLEKEKLYAPSQEKQNSSVGLILLVTSLAIISYKMILDYCRI